MIVLLRKATRQNLKLMFEWRNQPEVYQGFYVQGTENRKLTWGEHITWWEYRNRDWRTFIIEYESNPIGVVTIGQLDHWCPEIGYYIGEKSLWGKGIGKEAVRLGLEYIKNYGREYAHTTVLDTNERSIRLLKSLGFERLGKAREGESWYQKQL